MVSAHKPKWDFILCRLLYESQQSKCVEALTKYEEEMVYMNTNTMQTKTSFWVKCNIQCQFKNVLHKVEHAHSHLIMYLFSSIIFKSFFDYIIFV